MYWKTGLYTYIIYIYVHPSPQLKETKLMLKSPKCERQGPLQETCEPYVQNHAGHCVDFPPSWTETRANPGSKLA